MTEKQKRAIEVLNRIREMSFGGLSEEDYMVILEGIWESEMKPVQLQSFPFNIPAYQLPCYSRDGICTNPQKDCINCPKQGNYGSTWTTDTFKKD